VGDYLRIPPVVCFCIFFLFALPTLSTISLQPFSKVFADYAGKY
jgi:hypothetical protein